MKKLILIIAAVAMCHSIGFAQGCLPEGITFSTQAQIDNFQTNYPGCTEIEGDVTIDGSIANLNGLIVLISIGGNLSITANNALASLSGLESLDSIGGDLWIHNNHSLTNLSGLDNLTYIGDCLDIKHLSVLTNLTGLESLTSIGGGLSVNNNAALTSLSGLDNLNSIGGGLSIVANSSLSTCDAQWLCDYLMSPNGAVDICCNASGCGSIIEVAYACGGVPCLPNGSNYSFYSQLEIDLFQAAFPNCTVLQGDVFISGNDITDLSGLDAVTSIGGNLQFGWNDGGNPTLISLSGLESLDSIGGNLIFLVNMALTSLSGLDNLTSIGGNLQMGDEWWGNGSPALTSLSGLESLTSIGGNIYIRGNNALASLSGLDNIDAASITDLYIRNNPSLSTCEVQSICDYLAAPNGAIYIHDNANGCNSQEEVEEACERVGVEEPIAGSSCLIFPNPVTDHLNIQLSMEKPERLHIKVLNVSGQQMAAIADEQTKAGEYLAEIDISNWPAGVYLCRLKVGNEVVSRKIVKY